MRFSRKQLGIPYAVFLICFVIAPLLVVLYYAFTNGQGQFTVQNFVSFFTSENTIGTLAYSLVTAMTVTACCTLVAYPVAYILARSDIKKKNVLLVLFIAPMWINFTLRVVALKEVLTMVEGNLAYHPFLNTVLGMTYDFLPFMILPLYTTLEKLDKSYLEAAADLGASPVITFIKVTLPLSMSGLISGVTMVFLPSMTVGATDAHHYEQICDTCLRCSPFMAEPQEAVTGVHGINERIPVRAYLQGIRVLIDLMEHVNLSC